ncbi:efflux RND transporter periplasmic adaptor subunit [Pseudidiomarina sp. PP-1MA]|uniref:Efflux RND transporter periplasmic adaptor subunit n=1 Tax=Pseudidiomarina sp. PP-1MA TaxID=3237706 RepID=A0AB39X2Z0_9GAMM
MRLLTKTSLIVSTILLLQGLPAQVQAQQWGGDRAAVVLTESIGFERIQRRVDAVGYAEAVRSVALYPAVTDEVKAVNFKPGDRVEQGAVLVQLDDSREQIALQRTQIQLADAERTVERLQKSRAQGAVPQSELDDAITARDLLEITLKEIADEINDRRVIAPFSGVVGITDVEVGDRINPQTLITTIDQRDRLFVDFRAPEAAMEMLMNQAELFVRPWNAREAAYPAEIVEIDSRIDAANRTLRVRAVMDNSNDQFRPGMSFRVALEMQGDSYAVVPEAALMWSADGAYVWLNKDGKATRVDVDIRQRLAGRALVDGALQLGDELVVEGVQALRPGQALNPLNKEAAQP